MHIKATGQITLSAAFFQCLTTAANERAESRNAKACWPDIPLASCNLVVGLQCSYLKPGSCSKSPLIKLHDKFVQTSDSLSVMTSKTAPKKQPETPF